MIVSIEIIIFVSSGLKTAMQSSNHRLKELEDQNTLDKDRLRIVKTHLQILTTSNVHPHDSYQTKMDQLEEDLSNLTWRKRKFRALEKGLTVSMDRMQRKIDAIKLKVLVSQISACSMSLPITMRKLINLNYEHSFCY